MRIRIHNPATYRYTLCPLTCACWRSWACPWTWSDVSCSCVWVSGTRSGGPAPSPSALASPPGQSPGWGTAPAHRAAILSHCGIFTSLFFSAVDPEWFFRIRILLFSWFRILNLFLVLYINFTFVFLPCKCVRLLIMTRYKLFRGIFSWQKEIYILKLSIFVEKLSNFTNLWLGSSFTLNSFRIRSCSDPDPQWFFPDPDPAKSFGSKWIRIHNTAFLFIYLL